MDSTSNRLVGSIEYKFSEFEETIKIGEGGEAIVYKGRRATEKKYFAIKKMLKMNKKEAELLIEHSKHENIVKVYGLLIEEGSSKNHIGYFMEFMENGSLSQIIHNAEIKYTMRQFYLWIRQTAKGLNYLHRNKIIHRDIKPANLLIGNSLDVLKISDFGLAKSLDITITSITGGIGTIFYMSPEVIKSQKYSFPSDIYALSITIWEMFYRKRPYEEFTAETPTWIIHKQITEKNKRPAINGDSNSWFRWFQITNRNSSRTSLNDSLSRGWNVDPNKRPDLNKFILRRLQINNNRNSSTTKLNDLLSRGWNADPNKRPDLSEFITFAQINLEQSDNSQILCVGTDPETVQPSREQIKNSVMILGGLLYTDIAPVYTDSICIFNLKQNKWNDLHLKLPIKLFGHGSAMINSEIYIFGGYDQKFSKELYKLGENMEWIKLADMNEKRDGIGNSSIVFDDEIWVFGGWNGINRLKSVEKYNPKSTTWTMMPEMKYLRNHSAVSIINGKFYISGGFDGKNSLKTIEVFDPEANSWEIFCEMPFALDSHVSIADGTNLIIIGGDKSKFEPSDEVWKINVLDSEKKWIKMPHLNQKRYFHSAVKLSDGLMVIGGRNYWHRIIDTLEIFDGRKWTERKVDNMNGLRLSSIIPFTTKNEELFLQGDDLLKRCNKKLIKTLEIFDGRKWTERKVDNMNGLRLSSIMPPTTKNEELFLQGDDLSKRSQFLYDNKLIADSSITMLGGRSEAGSALAGTPVIRSSLRSKCAVVPILIFLGFLPVFLIFFYFIAFFLFRLSIN